MTGQVAPAAEATKFTGRGTVHYFPEREGFVVGKPVVLQGLISSSDFNGVVGSVEEISEDEESGDKLYIVKITNSELVKCRETNVKVGVSVEVASGDALQGEELQLRVKCSQASNLADFQTALGLALYDLNQPKLLYTITSVSHNDQKLQSTAPFKWVQAGEEILVEAEVAVQPDTPRKKSGSGCCVVM